MLIMLLVLSLILNGTLGYAILISNRKLEVLEHIMIRVMNVVDNTFIGLREIDHRGIFESDDDVGGAFQNILLLVQLLHSFVLEEEDDAIGGVDDRTEQE